MDDFLDPFSVGSPLHKKSADHCADAASPCGILAPEMTGLSIDATPTAAAAAAETAATTKVAPSTGSGILIDDLLLGAVKEGSPFADATSAGSSSGKESSPFGSNGFPEAKEFNDLVQQQHDDFDPLSSSAIPSSLSAAAPEFTPPSSLTNAGVFKAMSPVLSPDAPCFVPATIPEEDAAAIVDSWGPPLGLPPAKPAATTGAKPKSAAAPGARPKPAGSSAAARPGTASRRAASPASSTASGPAARKGTGAVAKKGAVGTGSAKSTPPPPAIVPFYVDVAYVPTQGKPEALGKFFSRVRAKNYVMSCVDSPAATLDALLDAKVDT